ncbi:anhydro-N-acetylmuramic acid kinase [Thiomicrorhabdus aquaedulcis]|uniref:anhydro-N-acetylmuramic acid kinase n=1 Tax=Thiomicrorhabdus aquaedulcis TaxID=2211106 RepID=UPI000FDB4442|nr:anhydro-N-acetylmuramic acid kinase [Thiomicrorhabdus aquaedulcis]
MPRHSASLTPCNTAHKAQYYIGLMSGTSADAVDAALVKFEGNTIELIDFHSQPLPSDLKQTLIDLNNHPNIALAQLSQLSVAVAQAFIASAHALLTHSGFKAQQICALGSHGQTIFHAPDMPMSLQIGHPALIAKTLGITTVADFRMDDMAVGGQGAPFAPAFHQPLFAAKGLQKEASGSIQDDYFVVNIGGIANISFLPANGLVLGFDTGPGNALMDEICQHHFNQPYDSNGQLAAQGTINATLLSALLNHSYFSQPAPKSTGRDVFNQAWLNQTLKQHALEDLNAHTVLCTLCELTAQSIAQSILKTYEQHTLAPAATLSKLNPCLVWVCGGGAFNGHLMQRLQHHLPFFSVSSSQTCHINPHAIEAMMCAWLAKQRIEHKPVALSAVTGATRDVILGGVWMA